MSIDLAFDDGQQAIAQAVAQLCSDVCDEDVVRSLTGEFPRDLWSQLAELGMLAIGTPEGDGGALEMVAAMESLGRAVFPGPLVGTFLAAQLLQGAERLAVIEGRSIVSAGSGGLMPWAPCADVFLEIDGERVFRAEPTGSIAAVETLGGEPWGRVELRRRDELEGGAAALVFSDVALAAYQAAAGNALVAAASEHAATRKQFGRAIGEFQAVAHPLADCSMRLAAATALVHNAAFAWDHDSRDERAAGTRTLANAARLSSNAASLEAAYVCHQVFGAIGVTLEGPAFHITRRIRQLASQPPGEAAALAGMLESIGLSDAD